MDNRESEKHKKTSSITKNILIVMLFMIGTISMYLYSKPVNTDICILTSQFRTRKWIDDIFNETESIVKPPTVHILKTISSEDVISTTQDIEHINTGCTIAIVEKVNDFPAMGGLGRNPMTWYDKTMKIVKDHIEHNDLKMKVLVVLVSDVKDDSNLKEYYREKISQFYMGKGPLNPEQKDMDVIKKFFAENEAHFQNPEDYIFASSTDSKENIIDKIKPYLKNIKT